MAQDLTIYIRFRVNKKGQMVILNKDIKGIKGMPMCVPTRTNYIKGVFGVPAMVIK